MNNIPVLYSSWNSSASWRVRAALAFKGIEYTLIPVNVAKGEQKHADYIAKNPSGLVPTLFYNNIYLNQSPAILEFLEEVFPTKPLLPKDAFGRAKVRALAAIICCDTHPIQNKSVLEKVSELRGKTGRDVEFAQWVISNGFRAYENMLRETMGRYSFGNEFTIADICLASQYYNATERYKVDLILRKAQPLKRNFSVDSYKNFKVEPNIGTEFERGSIQIRDILNAPNSDELLKDLAVLVSERNVVFLRDQDVTFDEQKEFIDRLGRAGGKPSTSGLHSHPIFDEAVFGEKRFPVSSDFLKSFPPRDGNSEFHSLHWHGSATYERAPPDYAITRIREVPPEGGDTLYASAYEVYERLSPAYRELLEGLTATHSGEGYKKLEAAGIIKINPGPRGAPEDVDTTLVSVHPVIRTNPVTGWKGVFVNKMYTKRINELSKDESDLLLNHLFELVTQNHDIQVRSNWGANDVAIWDERSTFYADTIDFDFESSSRIGDRVLSLGEVPFFEAESVSRRHALGDKPPVSRRAHLASLGLYKPEESIKEKAPQAAPTAVVPLRSKDSKLFNKVITSKKSTYKVGDKVTRTEIVTRTEYKPIEQ
ncbi:UNVERIFIED_CONTAM: hypothetical protein HDU68_012474 [Siphonaria sp. JEL0065]|nr:hypothetical protein HDU68_012474 [Siphonaria sp. JEL0065]